VNYFDEFCRALFKKSISPAMLVLGGALAVVSALIFDLDTLASNGFFLVVVGIAYHVATYFGLMEAVFFKEAG